MGVSFGAAVALSFAHSHPDRVKSVVANAPPIFYEPYLRANQGLMLWATDNIPLIKKIIHKEMVRGNALVWKVILGESPDLNDEFNSRVFAQIKRSDIKALDDTVHQIVSTDLRRILPSIVSPTLLLVGDRDYMYADSVAAARSIPNSTIIVLPGGHTICTERPKEFAASVTQFVKDF